ncbi:MAG: spore maturation protein A, partial [Clostridia bacterium]|nr:spore maturation protein A [Clostridia bacterium]
MLGKIYSLFFATSFLFSLFNGKTAETSQACINGVIAAVKFMLEMGALMAFWCGIMAVFESVGVLKVFARIIRPVLKLLFPTACKTNTATEEISVNITANILGLGNAATPMGINAMKKLSTIRGSFSDMAMLSVLNTASVQLVPTTLLSLRSLSGADDPYEIMLPVWVCSVITVVFAITIT